MNKQSKAFVVRRETINDPGKQPRHMLYTHTVNKGKQYPYHPPAARRAMLKPLLEQLRAAQK